RELQPEVAGERDDGAGRTGYLGAESRRQREPQGAVAGRVEPLIRALDRISIVAEIRDLGHVAEYHAVPGQGGLDGAQRGVLGPRLGIPAAVDLGAEFCEPAQGGAPAATEARRAVRQR